jgi:hypothetical protein
VEPDHRLYVALMFQPRTILGVVVLGIVLQSPWLFLGLSAALWWATMFPTQNLFDAIYSHGMAYPRGLQPVPTATAARRFAQGMAATLALAIGVALLSRATLTATVLEGLFAIGVTTVVVGRVCPPANLYLHLTGTATSAPSVPHRA